MKLIGLDKKMSIGIDYRKIIVYIIIYRLSNSYPAKSQSILIRYLPNKL